MKPYLLALGLALAGEARAKDITDTIVDDYCFNITPSAKILMQAQTTTPHVFVAEQPSVMAAINGMYFDSEGKLEGVAYLANGHHLATRKPEDIRGYFSVNRAGTKTHVGEQGIRDFSTYWLVIGTHPLLVTDGRVNAQALETRYNSRLPTFRSAIGTKNERDICFAVSNTELSMEDWARQLENTGHYGALNLDGGPISQLAVRDEGNVVVKGKGHEKTRLIIYVEKK